MTLPLEQRTEIRRLFFAEHWKVGTIARELAVHPDAVKAALETHTFVSRGASPRATLLEPYAELILRTLTQFPRLRATRLFSLRLHTEPSTLAGAPSRRAGGETWPR